MSQASPPTYRIDPALRAEISEAASRSDYDSDVRLREVEFDDRPFMIVTSGRVPAHVFRLLSRHGYEVVGVTHRGDQTNVHVAECQQ